MAIPFSRIKSGRKPDFDYDTIYESNNYGPFIILEESDIPGYTERAVKIKFLNTGTILTTKYKQVKTGCVKDPYAPTICGVACLGNASCYDEGHILWRNMIIRCYNPASSDYPAYGGSGVRVCERWHCFENFLADLPFIEGYANWVNNKNAYQLDKDYKQQNVPTNEKIYSLETCMFIPAHLNISLSNSTNSNKYVGVESNGGSTYRVRPRINGRRELIGVFESPEVEAAAYDNFMRYMYGDAYVHMKINNVPYISPEDVMKQNLHPRKMYDIIDENK